MVCFILFYYILAFLLIVALLAHPRSVVTDGVNLAAPVSGRVVVLGASASTRLEAAVTEALSVGVGVWSSVALAIEYATTAGRCAGDAAGCSTTPALTKTGGVATGAALAGLERPRPVVAGRVNSAA